MYQQSIVVPPKGKSSREVNLLPDRTYRYRNIGTEPIKVRFIRGGKEECSAEIKPSKKDTFYTASFMTAESTKVAVRSLTPQFGKLEVLHLGVSRPDVPFPAAKDVATIAALIENLESSVYDIYDSIDLLRERLMDVVSGPNPKDAAFKAPNTVAMDVVLNRVQERKAYELLDVLTSLGSRKLEI